MEERNWLVHHFLSEWKQADIQDTIGMIERLSDQHKRVAVEYKNIKAVFDEMGRISKTHASQAALEVSEFFWLRTSVLANLLGEFALASADADDWTDLASATHHCWEVEPKQMAQLKEIYGYARLKQAMLATQLFEFSDTSNQQSGGAKYRVNQHWGGRDQLNTLIPTH